ncbi:hypothetical protein B0H66DRAFT_547180 [Apodospora peruviana]|uniref:Uncharacterized protein n=1 Tax=Apodospora peruviana TaxID=516989 RepID=A0AAE0MA33_9PEZI|nr:hypothetical protein B0H66DRAFT_547180 [Apodospora peruviana]
MLPPKLFTLTSLVPLLIGIRRSSPEGRVLQREGLLRRSGWPLDRLVGRRRQRRVSQQRQMHPSQLHCVLSWITFRLTGHVAHFRKA